MKILIIAAAGALCAVSGRWAATQPIPPEHSWIGKTQNQIELHYGQPLCVEMREGGTVECFAVSGFTVIANFLNDVCWSVNYVKKPDRFGTGKSLSDVEIASILNAYAQDWRIVANGREWRSEDESITAIYDSGTHGILLRIMAPTKSHELQKPQTPKRPQRRYGCVEQAFAWNRAVRQDLIGT